MLKPVLRILPESKESGKTETSRQEGKSGECWDRGGVCVCVWASDMTLSISLFLSLSHPPTLSPPLCVVGRVGLVTHYKCQKDLSPKPVHLLLGAARLWLRACRSSSPPSTKDFPPIYLFSPSAQILQICTKRPISIFFYLLRSTRVISGAPLSWSSTRRAPIEPCRLLLKVLQGPFTAGLLLVNWYVTVRLVRAVGWWCQGMATKHTGSVW